MREFEDLAQLSDYIRQIEQENADLLEQVATLSCEVERYEDQYR